MELQDKKYRILDIFFRLLKGEFVSVRQLADEYSVSGKTVSRDINEIRSAIKYMDYKPVMLAKFYDIKSLLFKEILENEDYYKVASILPNPGNDNKIVKCVNILDKKYMAGREVVDCTKTPGAIPAEAAEVLKSIRATEDPVSVKLSFGKEMKAEVYMNIPRGNSLTISDMTITPETELTVMNLYNTYYTEGFTLALHFDDFAVAIEPSALDGIKGQGDVFVYAMTKNAIYKDFGSRYFDVAAILKYYRG